MRFFLMQSKITCLKNKNLPIVSDRETGIINAINNVFPHFKLLICWNHILRDAKDWLKRCGENEQNDIEIVKQIRCYLESPSET